MAHETPLPGGVSVTECYGQGNPEPRRHLAGMIFLTHPYRTRHNPPSLSA